MDLGVPWGHADGTEFVYVMADQHAGGVAFVYVVAGRPAVRNLPRTSDCIHLVHDEQPAEDSNLSALSEVDSMVVRILHKPGVEEGHRPRTYAVGPQQRVSRSSWVAAD